MTWIAEFAKAADTTDQLESRSDHLLLLAAGLMGEAGSIATEAKKKERERDAYPGYLRQMREEIGDFLWYYVRLVTLLDQGLLSELRNSADEDERAAEDLSLVASIRLGTAVGSLLSAIGDRPIQDHVTGLRHLLQNVWTVLVQVSKDVGVPLHLAAEDNIRKVTSRWPSKRAYIELFDNDRQEGEQLPRSLEIEFRERHRNNQAYVALRCNGIAVGDGLTDNIRDPDGYRFHDIFHFAYAVHLGWSPVIRALLRCKRKSTPEIDEAEDGARAGLIEEAVSAIVFSRAKHLRFFDGIGQIDYDLLKMVRGFVEGYEVERVPLWQWEAALIDGYRIFRLLRANRGGQIRLDLRRRELRYTAS